MNKTSIAVLMASPVDVEDLAIGFALSEGLVQEHGEIKNIELNELETGTVAEISVDNNTWQHRERNLAARSGCGICGVASLAELLAEIPRLADSNMPTREAVQRAYLQLRDFQPLNRTTRAAHVAAWCQIDGTIDYAREDIGRHNALDKLLGAHALRDDRDDSGFVFMSSRLSYELVQKCAVLGVSSLAAISAPTTLAIRLAQAANMNLIGFARDGSDWKFVCSDS